MPDWFALLYYGSLTIDATADTDGDGYSMLAEYQRDTDPLICDQIVAGGISRRRAAVALVNLAGYPQYTISCNPAGLFDVQSGAVPTGTVIQTASLSGANSGYTFSYWTVNGVRQADALGRALNQVAFTVTTDMVAVACYFANDADTDGDGIPDWWEGLYFGALTNTATADPDGDGYDLAAEYSRDASPLIVDHIVAGGVSRRRADTALVNLAEFCRYEIDCNPAGLFNTQVGAVATGTVVRTASLSGATSGYTFGYWTVNDARQADVWAGR